MSEYKPVEYFQMVLNKVRIFFGNRKRVQVWAVEQNGITKISVEGQIFYAPGFRRWRHYRHGVKSRLAAVAKRYDLAHVGPAPEGAWAVDVGGYMGEWSLYMLGLGYKVMVVEPDPAAASCLKKNLAQHAPAGAVWIHDPRVALDEAKEVSFFSEPKNADSSIFPSEKVPPKELKLTAVRLDDMIAEHIGDAPIIAFKMDAEGAEPEVLKGASNLLSRVRHVGIDAGAERQGEDTVEDCTRLLKDAGLTISTNSPDMVVAASR
nr:FkbM family methyltransferase [uncultured Cohaesibacter sp.]